MALSCNMPLVDNLLSPSLPAKPILHLREIRSHIVARMEILTGHVSAEDGSGHRHRSGGEWFYPSEMRANTQHLRCLSWGVGGTRLCTVPILKLPPLELLHGLSMVSHLTLLGIECWGEYVLKAIIVLASMYKSQSNTWVGMWFFLKASACDEIPNLVIWIPSLCPHEKRKFVKFFNIYTLALIFCWQNVRLW